MCRESEQGEAVRSQRVAPFPQIGKGAITILVPDAWLCRGDGVEHPCLAIELLFLLDELTVEPVHCAVDHAGADRDASLARERETPHDVARHEVVAGSFLPPSPTPVRVLEVVQAGESSGHHVVECGEILPALRMCRVGTLRLDAAEDPRCDRLAGHAEILECLRDDRRREEPAHRLLGAAVRIVDQIRDRVEHRDRHARRHGHAHLGRSGTALAGEVDPDLGGVSVHLAGAAHELLDSVIPDEILSLHRVGHLASHATHVDRRGAGLASRDEPLEPLLAAGRNCDWIPPECGRPAVDDRSQDLESVDLESGGDRQVVLGVVVDDCGDDGLVADDEEPRRLQTHDQWLLCSCRGGCDPEIGTGGRRACGGAPGGERVGPVDRDRGRSRLVGDDVGLPERGRAEVAPNHDGVPWSGDLIGRLRHGLAES